MYVLEILLIAFNLVMAWHHSQLIADGKKIYHGLWGSYYIAFAVLVAFVGKSWLLLILSLPIRKVVFDLSLNLFRGLPLFYVSTKTTSLIDKAHNYLFGKNSEVYMAFYFIIIIALNFLL